MSRSAVVKAYNLRNNCVEQLLRRPPLADDIVTLNNGRAGTFRNDRIPIHRESLHPSSLPSKTDWLFCPSCLRTEDV